LTMSEARRSDSGDAGRDVQLANLDPGQQALHLTRVEAAGAEVLRGPGPAGDAVGEALARRGALEAGRHVAGQEAVTGAHGGDRLQRLDLHLVTAPAGALAAERH